MTSRPGNSVDDLIILAHSFHPVSDEHYEMDPQVGARFNSAAIRAALQIAYSDEVGVFHVHLMSTEGYLARAPPTGMNGRSSFLTSGTSRQTYRTAR